ncbi:MULTISPECIES: hypothetical protein [Halorubrum]|uniref:Uncharacterized protein n=1 Tax=Halorubrum ruber TaxID=2982524 RepID=A0A8T8LQD8_9EURY|nr:MULTISPECIES: hypothetical protein [Halorubrum]QUO49045.1 hypothetical protein J7656_06850 [Halorubrum ruber]
MSDRSAQRACARFPAGALEVVSVDPRSGIYKRAAGALEVVFVDLLAVIYKRAAGALEIVTAPSATYK